VVALLLPSAIDSSNSILPELPMLSTKSGPPEWGIWFPKLGAYAGRLELRKMEDALLGLERLGG